MFTTAYFATAIFATAYFATTMFATAYFATAAFATVQTIPGYVVAKFSHVYRATGE